MALTNAEALDAADYNKRKCQPVGWKSSYGRICAFLKITPATATNTSFARAIEAYQAGATPKLTEDGKLGPSTWGRLKPAMDAAGTTSPATAIPIWLGGSGHVPTPGTPTTPTVPSGPTPTGPAPWFEYAKQERDRWAGLIASWAGDASKSPGNAEAETDWDELYFRASPYFGAATQALGTIPSRANRDWCAAFANYCLHRAGYSHTGSAGAHSFLRHEAWMFDALTEPKQGCIIVVGNSQANGGFGKGAHVAFLDSWHNLPKNPGKHVKNVYGRNANLLGGNQLQKVCSRREPTKPQSGDDARKRDFLAVKGRNGVKSPYLWPLVGPPHCVLDAILPTDQPHHCSKIPTS